MNLSSVKYACVGIKTVAVCLSFVKADSQQQSYSVFFFFWPRRKEIHDVSPIAAQLNVMRNHFGEDVLVISSSALLLQI